ncbi:hypothetical protein LCGC14_0548520 [marine sediment metagenome]|uniref:Uncharacterized protein n=1 Tax=marine sediment metagenome TaxID=412755 RepID=A0A0F9S904_9ZZZZ
MNKRLAWEDVEDGYPKFEKGKKHHRLHWQKCLFLASDNQDEAYAKVEKYVSIELPSIKSIPGYIPIEKETINDVEESS